MFKLSNYFFVKMNEAAAPEAGGAAGGDSFLDVTPDAGAEGAESADHQEGVETPEGQAPEGGEADQQEPVDRPDWLPEKFNSVEDMAKSYGELEGKLGAFTGAPESGEYELALPEGAEDFQFFEHEKHSVQAFQKLAGEMGISQEGFNKLLGFYVDSRIYEGNTEMANARTQSIEFAGGADRVQTISAKAKAQLSPENFELFRKAASTSPDAAGAAMKLVDSLLGKEQKPIGTEAHAPQPVLTESELRDMMNDPKYKVDPEYRKKVSDGFKRLYPE